MKQLITTAVLLFSITAFAQVGINNTSPKATLDITAKTTDGSKPEGLIIPQLTGDKIRIATTATPTPVYGTAQKGLIVYASAADSAPTGATASITAPGYYYFDGSAWQKMSGAAATDATTSAKGIVQLAGDLAGTATAPTVAKIQSKAVSSTAPTNGQVLKYNTSTSAWEPAADIDTNTTYTAGSGMTLTGTSFSANDATTSAKGIVQLAGDLAGTATAPTVAKIQNKAVSSIAPTNGQVLKYNTTTSAWEPAADIDTNTTYTAGSGMTLTGTSFSANDATTSAKGIVQLAGDLAGTAASPTVAKIQSKAVSSTAPTNGQVLKYNTSTSTWEPAADTDTNTTYTAGSGMTLTGTSFSANDATTTTKGIVQLSGDLAGTAASPSIAGNAVNSAKIADGTVANGDLANMAAFTVKGNATNAVAAPTDIAAGTDGYVLRRSGTSLGFGTVATAGIADGAVTTNKIATDAITSTQIATGAVSNVDLASAAALTVKGNATNAAASPTDIAAGTDGYVLRRSGTALGFGTVATAGIADGAVTANKMTLSNGKIYLGNSSNAAAEVSLSGDVTMDNAGVVSIGTGKVTNSQLSAVSTGTGGIYKGSGSLAGNTTVAQNANTLAFTSSAASGTSHFTVDGTTLNVDAVNNRVGIGTSAPGNLLEISSSSSNTGLKLPYGAAAGKILTSDAAGNSSWQTTNSVFIYSEVHSTGGSTSFSSGSVVNFFHTIKGENVKSVYGNSYGWIDATQRWVSPYTGKFRVTTNMYFNPGSSTNPRLYAFINGTTVCNITSAANNGSYDGTSYTSAIVSLNQGDYIQWKAWNSAVLYGDNYHTFIRVESVE